MGGMGIAKLPILLRAVIALCAILTAIDAEARVSPVEPKQERVRPTDRKPAPKDKPQTEPPISASKPMTTVLENAQETADNAKHREEAEQREKDDLAAQQTMAWATKWIYFLTWGQIAIGTIGGLLLLFTLRVSSRATKAAERAANVAEAALKDRERAFVHIKSFNANPLPAGFLVQPQWANSGSTPTRHMRSHISWSIFNGEPPPNFDFPDLDATGQVIPRGSQSILVGIAPNAEIFGQDLRIPTAAINRAIAGERIFIWGWCEYRDVFNGTPLHVTRFCNEMSVEPSSVPNALGVMFRLYARNNCADEEC